MGRLGSSMGKNPELVHQWFVPGLVREAYWTPLHSEAVSRVVRLGFPTPLNPEVKKMTRTLRADTDIPKS